ncbi:hypothetical protein BC829DRAFT_412095 [Chytridium lagenaria]|nr:hypothetical protein BC829DRAFT_412095 [Chytridium lagenaria]
MFETRSVCTNTAPPEDIFGMVADIGQLSMHYLATISALLQVDLTWAFNVTIKRVFDIWNEDALYLIDIRGVDWERVDIQPWIQVAKQHLPSFMQAISQLGVLQARQSGIFGPTFSGPTDTACLMSSLSEALVSLSSHDTEKGNWADPFLDENGDIVARSKWFRDFVFNHQMSLGDWYTVYALVDVVRSTPGYRSDWEAAGKALLDVCELSWIDTILSSKLPLNLTNFISADFIHSKAFAKKFKENLLTTAIRLRQAALVRYIIQHPATPRFFNRTHFRGVVFCMESEDVLNAVEVMEKRGFYVKEPHFILEAVIAKHDPCLLKVVLGLKSVSDVTGWFCGRRYIKLFRQNSTFAIGLFNMPQFAHLHDDGVFSFDEHALLESLRGL